MKYKVFGCKVNKYYTDEWLNSPYLKDKLGVFVASCVVTDKAKKKWLKFVKQELQILKENEKIYISGCGAFEKGAENKEFFEIYDELKEFKNQIEILGESPQNFSNISPFDKGRLGGIVKLPKLALTTKKFLVIQGGCDSFCSFCLTVIKRGKHFYRSLEDIVDEITEFEMQGGKEVVLTGINLGAWGSENTNDYKNSKFDELLKYILEKTEIPRIRISSLGPEFVNEKVLKIFENKRIYPHFHLSIQSGSSNILASMRRHYNGEYMKELLKKILNIKREDGVNISIGSDLIVGFPGETESDFIQTYDLVKNFNITKLHCFPFSNHTFGESVPASFYSNQIDEKTKKDRVDRLNSIGEEVRNNFITSQKGKTLNVLIESIKDGNFKGWSENYIECNSDNFEVISGIIKKNEIIVGKLK
ncbi:MAG: MiaB/RimO family radical SAM methylthiotransferase [Candidatus Gracilibacteria bacterium]|nr:MiaB/RimO family radical SAM methylthiotransferase [Candidatus Gracilibacteria bacterium]